MEGVLCEDQSYSRTLFSDCDFILCLYPVLVNPSVPPVVGSMDITKHLKCKVLGSHQVLPLIASLSVSSLTMWPGSPLLHLCYLCFSLNLDLNVSSQDIIMWWQLLRLPLFDHLFFPFWPWLSGSSVRASDRKAQPLLLAAMSIQTANAGHPVFLSSCCLLLYCSFIGVLTHLSKNRHELLLIDLLQDTLL